MSDEKEKWESSKNKMQSSRKGTLVTGGFFKGSNFLDPQGGSHTAALTVLERLKSLHTTTNIASVSNPTERNKQATDVLNDAYKTIQNMIATPVPASSSESQADKVSLNM